MSSVQKYLFLDGGWGTKIGRNFLSFEDRAIPITYLKSALKTLDFVLECQQCGRHPLAAVPTSFFGFFFEKVPFFHKFYPSLHLIDIYQHKDAQPAAHSCISYCLSPMALLTSGQIKPACSFQKLGPLCSKTGLNHTKNARFLRREGVKQMKQPIF